MVGCGGGGGGGGGGGFVLGLEKRGRAVLLGKEERGEGKDAVEAAAERWLEREKEERGLKWMTKSAVGVFCDLHKKPLCNSAFFYIGANKTLS